jgi:hypothetical protein
MWLCTPECAFPTIYQSPPSSSEKSMLVATVQPVFM